MVFDYKSKGLAGFSTTCWETLNILTTFNLISSYLNLMERQVLDEQTILQPLC